MKEEKDKIFDDLFKKALGEPEHQEAFNEADWLSLEEALDNARAKKRMVFWLPIISTAAVLLVFVGFWIFYKKGPQFGEHAKPELASQHKKNNGSSVATNNQQNAATVKKQSLISNGTDSANRSGSTANNHQNVIDKKGTVLASNSKLRHIDSVAGNHPDIITSKGTVLASNHPQGSHTVGSAGVHQNADNNKEQLLLVGRKNHNKKIRKNHIQSEHSDLEASTKPGSDKNSLMAQQSTKGKPDIGQNISKPNGEQNNAPDQNGQLFDGDSTGILTYSPELGIKDAEPPSYDLSLNQNILSKVPADSSAKTKPKKPEKKAFSGIFIQPVYALTVIGATELNGVNSFQQTRSGSNFGALFSAEIINRLTISSGASYSIKPYNSLYSSYHTDHYFYVDPSNVQADCKVLDIPLNFDYRIFNDYQNKISIGTGLSSYIMLHENYLFNYPAGSGINQFSYTVPNTNKYFFGVINFQATYLRQINSKFGISLQPYLKLPLAGIGAGQVNLQTTGLALGVTWNFNSY